MSSFKIFYLNDINRLQAVYKGVEANVEVPILNAFGNYQ